MCGSHFVTPRGTEGQFKKDTANEPFSLIYTDNKKADITFISYGIMINRSFRCCANT